MTEEQCNATKADGEPCTYPAKYEDGRCGIHTDVSESGGPGRPSEFTEAKAQDAIEAAERGKSKAGCARSAGIGKATLERWLEEHGDFRNAFTHARGKGEDRLLEGGLYDPDVDSSMAKFLLASSFDYVKAEKREHTGEGGGSIVIHTEAQDE